MRFLFYFLSTSLLINQVRVGEWDAYTSPLEIADLVEVDSLLISATNGGLLIYDRDLDAFDVLTKLDGLSGTDLGVVKTDPNGQIWIGGALPDGFIHILDGRTFSVLETFDLDLTAVTDITISDSVAFAAFQQNQDWGIMEFPYDGDRYFYKDVYNNWPVTLNNISGLIMVGDILFVGTDQGLFWGNWKTSNLKDPSHWQSHNELTGNITTFHKNGEKILLVMDRDIYEFEPSTETVILVWDYYHDSSLLIDVIEDNDGGLWGVLNKSLIRMSSSSISWQKKPGERFKRLFYLNDGTVVAGTTTGLLLFDDETHSFTRVKPNCPSTNAVSALTVMSDGRLVAGSRLGLMIRETEGWRNIVGINGDDTKILTEYDYQRFVADTLPVHFGNYIADIEEGPDGLLYCGIRGTYPEPRQHGGGILIIDVDDPSNFTLIDTSHLDYFADEYMIVKDIAEDPAGNLWFADTYATTNFEPIKLLKPDGTWGKFNVTESGGKLALTPNTIDFDSQGRVWIGSFEDNNNVSNSSNGGLVMLDYSGDPVDPDETEWAKVPVNQDNSTQTIWSLGVNSNDILFLLSPKGLIGLTLQFSNSDPIQNYGFTYFPNIAFNAGAKLRIDPKDNVWVSSPSQGVFVLTSSASYWPDINGLTEDYSNLLSNNVTDIAFDGENGLAYIATNKGISVLKIPFSRKKESYSDVSIFPSPYHVPNDIPLTIDGLKDESSCKIMTLNGRVLKTVESRIDIEGYQAFWDGRDESGHWVGTGVYLIALYDKNGSSSFRKIAVIRH